MDHEPRWEFLRSADSRWPEAEKCPHVWRVEVPAGASGAPADLARCVRETARSAERLVLSRYLQVTAADLRLTREPSGRPFVEGRRLDFNISHSGKWVVLAVATPGPVGVDVERMDAHRDLNAIATRYFAPHEAETVSKEGAPAFYRFWTAKEAALKSTGAGIAGGLEETLLRPGQGKAGDVLLPNGTVLNLQHFPVAPGYLGAVAWKGHHDPPPKFYEIESLET